MQEKTIKSYNDEKNRVQLLQCTNDMKLYYQVRVNRRVTGMWYNIINANKAFQATVYSLVMQTKYNSREQSREVNTSAKL